MEMIQELHDENKKETNFGKPNQFLFYWIILN